VTTKVEIEDYGTVTFEPYAELIDMVIPAEPGGHSLLLTYVEAAELRDALTHMLVGVGHEKLEPEPARRNVGTAVINVTLDGSSVENVKALIAEQVQAFADDAWEYATTDDQKYTLGHLAGAAERARGARSVKFGRSTTQEVPTLEERHNAAAAKADAALSVFADVQSDLEDAAREHELAAELAQAEIDRLFDVVNVATLAAGETRTKAARIAELIG